MLVKIEIVDITDSSNPSVTHTEYVVTDSIRRTLDMYQDDETTDVRYHILTATEERKYYAAKMGGATSPAKAQSSAANGKLGAVAKYTAGNGETLMAH